MEINSDISKITKKLSGTDSKVKTEEAARILKSSVAEAKTSELPTELIDKSISKLKSYISRIKSNLSDYSKNQSELDILDKIESQLKDVSPESKDKTIDNLKGIINDAKYAGESIKEDLPKVVLNLPAAANYEEIQKALPEAKKELKARKEETATTFPVEIAIRAAQKVTLRAGFSANADIIIRRSDKVLTVPERVVYFEKGETYVMVPKPDGTSEKRAIKTGLSDAINVEVTAGLKENEKVLEKPQKEIK